jgi:hypothetical protein
MTVLNIAVAVCLAPAARAQETLSYADLVGRLTDLAHLAVLPQPGEKGAQWSSYDRASKYDEKTGKYVSWGANADNSGIIRQEGDVDVLAEMDGPGCIWRIWSATAKQGHVKIYLDGAAEPAVDLPLIAYFDGKHAPFTYAGIGYDMMASAERTPGFDLYMPIPYQKSCKIVGEKEWGSYYHFTYATYPQGTRLPTFSTALAAENATVLKKADQFLSEKLGTDPAGPRPGETRHAAAVTVAAGKTATAAQLKGPAAITAVRLKMQFKDREDQIAALRRLALRITWDGRPEPAVWCPLGDFFGTAPGENLYKTLVTGMTAEGYYAYWYMPFATSALVEVINDDSLDRRVEFETVQAPLGRPFDGLGHFHAKWHRDTVTLPPDRYPDWTMLRAQGCGRYCGVMLHVWNPWGGWWGEGDEKFFVDGERFPSTFGTGSEDYFGYAWCSPLLFQRPFHAQTMTQSNKGHQSLLRWQVTDNVPFHTSFEGCIEKYFDNRNGTLYACTVCWYQSPDGKDPYKPLPVADRYGYWLKPEVAIAGLKVLNDQQDWHCRVFVQDMSHHGHGKWNSDEELRWDRVTTGNRLELGVPDVKPGVYEISVQLTKGRDFGIVQFYLDGKKLGEPVDLYSSKTTPVPSGYIALGRQWLDGGRHTLVVELVGANPQAKTEPRKTHRVGISDVRFQPVQ